MKTIYFFKIFVLFLIYFITATVGLKLDAVSGFATLVWPPTGIALAALLLFGFRLWPGIFLGAFLVNFQTGAPLLVALGIGIGNTLEALVGVYLLRRVGFQNSLERLRDVLALIIAAALFSTLVSATIGVTSLWLGGVVSLSAFGGTWLAWWIGDVLGDLIIAPFLLTWLTRAQILFDHWRLKEATVLAVTLAGVGLLAFGNHLPLARGAPIVYMIFIPLIWAALRFGQRGTANANFLISLIAILGTIRGLGPFVTESLSQSLTFLQLFIGVVSVTTMILAAVVTERKRTEKELRESEIKFRSLVENTPSFIVLVDRSGKILFVNRVVAGLRKESVVGKSMYDFVLPENIEKQREIIEKVFSTGKAEMYETKGIGPLGSLATYQINTGPLFDDGEIRGAILVATDITDRKKAEDSLREASEQFKKIFEENPVGMTMVSPKGAFMKANKAYQELLGYTEEELQKLKVADVTHPEDVESTKELIRAVFAGEIPLIRTEKRYITKDESVVWARITASPIRDNQGKPLYNIAIVENITERKRAEEKINFLNQELRTRVSHLQEEQARDYAILDNIGEGLVVVDAGGRILIANKQIETMFGWSPKELSGKRWHDIAILEDEKGISVNDEKRPLSTALARKERITANQYYFVRKDKTRFPVSITASPVALNGIIGAVEIFRDITKEKELDRAKSGFISLASHQLRTPLSATKWLIELLMEGKLTDTQKENIKNLAISNERLINLVNDLLNISRLESAAVVANPQSVHIGELIGESIKLYKLKADKDGKKIEFSSEAGIQKIFADPVLFNEAFENILDNAISYSPKNSIIEVTIKKKDKNYVISVHNEGEGIPEEGRDKIFTRFYRSEQARKLKPEGSGLGLFIAKSAVEANGGKIRFESEKGKGVTFFIELPIRGKESV
jgi:PAS domain S-box-containing protein